MSFFFLPFPSFVQIFICFIYIVGREMSTYRALYVSIISFFVFVLKRNIIKYLHAKCCSFFFLLLIEYWWDAKYNDEIRSAQAVYNVLLCVCKSYDLHNTFFKIPHIPHLPKSQEIIIVIKTRQIKFYSQLVTLHHPELNTWIGKLAILFIWKQYPFSPSNASIFSQSYTKIWWHHILVFIIKFNNIYKHETTNFPFLKRRKDRLRIYWNYL